MSYLRAGLRELNDGIRKVALEYPNVVVIDPPATSQTSVRTNKHARQGPSVIGPSAKISGLAFDSEATVSPDRRRPAAIARDVSACYGVRDSRRLTAGSHIEVGFETARGLSFDQVTTPGSAAIATLDPRSAPPNTDFSVLGDVVQITASADHGP